MRALTWVVVVVAVLWAGVWAVASRLLDGAAHQWLADQVAQGLTAEAGITVQGFPSRLDVVLTEPRFGDPRAGLRWEAPMAEIDALIYKPWHIILSLPETQRIETYQGAATLTSTRLRISLRVGPSTLVPFEHLGIEGDTLGLTADQGTTLTLDTLRAAVARLPDRAATYGVSIEAAGLGPDPAILTRLPARTTLPPKVETLTLHASLGLTAPIDRNAGEAQPNLDTIDVSTASLIWGPIKANAVGTLKADADGFAEGRVTLTLAGWQAALDAASAMGLLSPDQLASFSNIAARAAASTGTPDTIELPLTFAQGRVAFGFIPLGPAPSFLP